MKKFLGMTILTLASVNILTAEEPDYLLPQPEAIEAWKDMRFGMFICWGPVSLKGTEIGWSRGREIPLEEYDNLYKRWNPTQYDAKAWAKVVTKKARYRYVIDAATF